MADNFYADTKPMAKDEAEDNLKYGSKKYFKQSRFKNFRCRI